MKHYYFWTVVTLIFTVELYSLLPVRKELGASEKIESTGDILSGVIHVHSNFSDGGGTPEEIAKSANDAGLDFVILTDHNNYEARKRGLEGTYGKTDLFVEMESSTPVGHAISFFSQSEQLKNASPQTIIDASYRQFLKKESHSGLFVAVAHPSNIKNPWGRLDDFAEGLEVVNFDSGWQRQASESPLQFLLTLAVYPFNSFLSSLRFLEIYPKDFGAWDEMTSRGPGHFAYLAHDTHAKIKINNERSISWPGYLQTFKLASNLVFLKEPKSNNFSKRRSQLYESLLKGRSAIHYRATYPYLNNQWRVKCGSSEYSPGDVLNSVLGCQAIIRTPSTPFVKIIRLIKDGEIMNEVPVSGSAVDTVSLKMNGPGTYRVEVWAKLHTALRLTLNRLAPYVFYSPIYLQ